MKETLEAIYKTYFDYYYSLQSQFLQSFGLYTNHCMSRTENQLSLTFENLSFAVWKKRAI